MKNKLKTSKIIIPIAAILFLLNACTNQKDDTPSPDTLNSSDVGISSDSQEAVQFDTIFPNTFSHLQVRWNPDSPLVEFNGTFDEVYQILSNVQLKQKTEKNGKGQIVYGEGTTFVTDSGSTVTFYNTSSFLTVDDKSYLVPEETSQKLGEYFGKLYEEFSVTAAPS